MIDFEEILPERNEFEETINHFNREGFIITSIKENKVCIENIKGERYSFTNRDVIIEISYSFSRFNGARPGIYTSIIKSCFNDLEYSKKALLGIDVMIKGFKNVEIKFKNAR